MQLSLMQWVTLVASVLGLVSHAAQLGRSLRSGSIRGLSLSSFVLLTVTFTLSLLMGIQYRIGPGLIVATVSTVLTVAVLALLSRRITALYFAVVGVVVLATMFGPPVVADAVLTTRYSEVVAFAWGLLFASAFVPQVVKAHRLGDTRDLSKVSIVVTTVSVGLWLTFAILVRNISMAFWLSLVMLSVLELARLKLTEGKRAPRTASPATAGAKRPPVPTGVST